MFNEKIVRQLAIKYNIPLSEMAKIEKELNERFFNFDDPVGPVRALILSVLSNETLLLVGPPGTGKSQLIRDFCKLIGIKRRNDWMQDLDTANKAEEETLIKTAKETPYYFEYLLTRFTEPGELFGYFDIGKLQYKPHKLVRDTTGMMQYATIVYLDEVFRGSSAILNALLAFLNERTFHDRGNVMDMEDIKVQALFSATNDIPTTPDLKAVFDRFVVRCWVHNLADNEPEGINDLTGQMPSFLKKAWRDTYRPPHKEKPTAYRKENLLKDIKKLNEDINKEQSILSAPNGATQRDTNKLSQIVTTLADNGLGKISNRRLVKMVHLMLLATIYRASKEGNRATCLPTAEEFKLYHYFLDVDPNSEAVKDDIVKIDEELMQ